MLQKWLETHRNGFPQEGFIFAGPKMGRPLNLANLARRTIVRELKKGRGEGKTEVEWHGWHAFRRGLATNLNRLGVPAKTIQGILRHANIRTTMDIYVKAVRAD